MLQRKYVQVFIGLLLIEKRNHRVSAVCLHPRAGHNYQKDQSAYIQKLVVPIQFLLKSSKFATNLMLDSTSIL